MKRNSLILLLLLLVSIGSLATDIVPSTDVVEYYSVADGTEGAQLRAALNAKIAPHTLVSYDNLRYIYQWTDTYNNEGLVIDDIYSHCDQTFTTSFCSGNCGFNREHSLPKSWFGTQSGSQMYSDVFHLYPTNCYVNSERGNLAFGECAAGSTYNNKSKGVQGKGRKGVSTFVSESGTQYRFSESVYEPDDEYKGDLARSYFYMVTCYMTTNFTQETGGKHMFVYVNGKADLSQYSIDLLMKWHRQDPVSMREIRRNEVIYGNTTYNKSDYKQGNRNPFIDYPYLAEYIWGERAGETVDMSHLMPSCDAEFVPGVSNGWREQAGPTDVEETTVQSAGRTLLIDGQLYIDIDGKRYNILGGRVE